MRQVLDRVHNFFIQCCRRKSAVSASRLVVPPWIEVSWQITGVQQHRSARPNPLVVEPLKSRRGRGYFIYPELSGSPGGQGYSVGSPPTAHASASRGTKRAGGCESRSERGYPLRPIFCYRWFRTDENAPSIEVIQLLSRFESLHDSTANCRQPPAR